MRRWKILCALLSGMLLISSAWAQKSQSVMVVESGQLIEKTITDGRLEQRPLSASDSVMYLYGSSPATGEILFSKEEGDNLRLALIDPFSGKEQDLGVDVLWASWSRSGDRFFYYDDQGALFLVQNGDQQRLTLGVAAAAFSPDGQYLALVRTPELSPNANDPSTGLWVMDLNTRAERRLTARTNENWAMVGYAPYWLPDGRHILFIAEGGPTPFWLADVRRGEAQPVSAPDELPTPTTLLYFSPDGQRAFFGSEALDAPDTVWALDLSGLSAGWIERAQKVGEGSPLGFAAEGGKFLVASEDAIWQVDPQTLAVEKVADVPEEELPILAPSALYRVKYYAGLPNGSWRVTSWFSHNRNRTDGGPYRFDCQNFGRTGHRGIDMGAGLGTRIDAAAGGTVDFVSRGCGYTDRCQSSNFSCGGGFGNYARIKHSNGATTYYGHQKSTVARSGQRVNCHTKLGLVGSTGHSFGCHLHFEIRFNSRSTDPYKGACNWINQSLWVQANNPHHCR